MFTYNKKLNQVHKLLSYLCYRITLIMQVHELNFSIKVKNNSKDIPPIAVFSHSPH